MSGSRKYITRVCPNCGKTFTTKLKRTFACSKSCGTTIAHRRRIERQAAEPTDSPDVFRIALNKGQYAEVSACDADLGQHKWRAVSGPTSNTSYAHRTVISEDGVKTTEQLHRVIMERKIGRPLERHELTDHADLNGLNCKRDNLRLADNTQNQANTKRRSLNNTGFKGVTLRMGLVPKWRAAIGVRGRRIYLGTFDTPEAAHAAYVSAAEHYFGEFANDGT